MAVIQASSLSLRYVYDCYGDECGTGTWYIWGRWVLLGVVVVVCLVLLFLTRAWSSRRVLNGRRPIAGTAWMVPPSYYSSQQQYNQTAPPYNPNPGYNDAGYYDAHGNFIRNNVNNGQPFPSVPETHEMNEYPQEKSAYRAPNVSMPEPAYTSPGTVPPPEVGSSSRYEPPSGPPPANRSYDV